MSKVLAREEKSAGPIGFSVTEHNSNPKKKVSGNGTATNNNNYPRFSPSMR